MAAVHASLIRIHVIDSFVDSNPALPMKKHELKKTGLTIPQSAGSTNRVMSSEWKVGAGRATRRTYSRDILEDQTIAYKGCCVCMLCSLRGYAFGRRRTKSSFFAGRLATSSTSDEVVGSKTSPMGASSFDRSLYTSVLY